MKYLINSIIETFCVFVRILFSNKPIVLGPYHGEFGFEVTMNSSVAFSLKNKFNNKLIVVSVTGNDSLYSFCDEYISFSYDLKDAGYGYGKAEDALVLRDKFLVKHNNLRSSIFVDLTLINMFLFKRFIEFRFVDLSTSEINITSRIVTVHFRTILKNGIDSRVNFEYEKADQLVKELFELGYKVYIIGHPRFSYCPSSYCEDHRSDNIDKALNAISESFIVVGQLSGPIHLAHMANRPVITWADSINRFETIKMWNPHNQVCIKVSNETFNPDVGLIVNSIVEFG